MEEEIYDCEMDFLRDFYEHITRKLELSEEPIMRFSTIEKVISAIDKITGD